MPTPSVRWITVRSTAPRKTIEAYLYATATLVSEEPGDGRVQVYKVRVEATEDRVDYVAQNQADRLASGWHFATVSEEA